MRERLGELCHVLRFAFSNFHFNFLVFFVFFFLSEKRKRKKWCNCSLLSSPPRGVRTTRSTTFFSFFFFFLYLFCTTFPKPTLVIDLGLNSSIWAHWALYDTNLSPLEMDNVISDLSSESIGQR